MSVYRTIGPLVLYFPYFCSKQRLWVHIRTDLMSTHNLCFRAKIRKIGMHNPVLHNPVLLYIKVGYTGGIYYMEMLS